MVVEFLLDHRWRDRRTKLYKKLRLILPLVLLFAAITSVFVVISDHRSAQKLISELHSLRQQGIDTSKAASTERQELMTTVLGLEHKLKPFIEAANMRFPEAISDDEGLQQLVKEVQSLRQSTRALERGVKTLDVSLKMRFRGDWSAKKIVNGERPLFLKQTDPYITFRRGENEDKYSIKFFPKYVYRQKLQADGTVTVDVDASVLPGDWPLGQMVDILKGYTRCEFAIPMITQKILNKTSVTLENFVMKVFVNGQLKLLRDDQPNIQLAIPKKGIRVASLEVPDLLEYLRREK